MCITVGLTSRLLKEGVLLDREKRYFRCQQKFLSAMYPGKYVVISGDTVVGVYEDKWYAFRREAYDNHRPIGSFLVCHVDEYVDGCYVFSPRLTPWPPE